MTIQSQQSQKTTDKLAKGVMSLSAHSYPQYAQEFAQALASSIENLGSGPTKRDGHLTPHLIALIDAFPYYGDVNFESAHRGALANLLQSYLPNKAIAPPPVDGEYGYVTVYSYKGSYSGYQRAFYPGVSVSTTGGAVLQEVSTVDPTMSSHWWGHYGTAILTDAIREAVSMNLHTSKLRSALASYNTTFLPGLSASYLAVFSKGYAPTTSALDTIYSAGEQGSACTALEDAIAAGQFTANINQSLSMGGEGAISATWFLFNLWITLKALGSDDVDSAIRRFEAAGLDVPPDVGPGRWWSGGYVEWYTPLSGADVLNAARNTIVAKMPIHVITTYTIQNPPPPVRYDEHLADGYASSFCEWGSLAKYKAD